MNILQVMRRYHIQDRDDYKQYNKLCGLVTKVTSVLKKLDPKDPHRIEMTDQLLDKSASSAPLAQSWLCPESSSGTHRGVECSAQKL